ncbi:DUF3054 domain-containing protein [Natronorubrum sp. DTA28]|uniref:DUF3054 domain-containing protein n=1 Tax=Natronorubrum sp. DTA28 TaxID=3447019 RepID=UPI003F833E8F
MDTAVRTASRSESVDRKTLLVAVGDIGLLAGLVLVGQLSHNVNPIDQPVASLEAIAPFVIGWLAVAALAGLYTRSVAASVTQSVRLTTVTWIAAANVGLLLRQTVFGDTAVWPFPLVMTGFGLLLLVGWRIAVALITDRL